MDPWATTETSGGRHVLRFVRRLAHPPEKVFRAISEPDELRHWFPVDAGGDRRVVEEDPPRLLVMRWEQDELRFEVVPEPGGGCRLLLHAPAGAGRHVRRAAGSRAQRGGLGRVPRRARRAPQGAPAPERDWFALFEGYAERFGLGRGRGRRRRRRPLRARRRGHARGGLGAADRGRRGRGAGAPAPRRFAPAPPGPVTAVEPERALALDTDAGPVRWTLEPSMPGTLIGVRLQVADPAARPAALAAWQVHLELLVAALQGIERCWPGERVAALEARYAARG